MNSVRYQPGVRNWMNSICYQPGIRDRVSSICYQPSCRTDFCGVGIRDVGAKSGTYEQECEREQNGELNRTHEPSSEIKSEPGDENSRCWKTHE
jgi:hypothetical protein